MGDVVSEVDRLMDEKMNFRKGVDSGSEESDVLSMKSAGSGTRTRSRKVEEKSDKGIVKQSERKISGKSKNSFNSQIKFQQKWSHNFLNQPIIC